MIGLKNSVAGLDTKRGVLFYGLDLRNKLKEVQSGCTKIKKLCKTAERSQHHIAFVSVPSGSRSFYYSILLA